jgi:nucleotide-binding universal stress UspA family protein
MSDQKIVVPLDGSALAEKALPFAVALARLRQQKLLLLRVVREQSFPERSSVRTQEVEEANAYLEQVKKEISQKGLPNWIAYDQVETHVVTGRSAHDLGEIVNSLEASQVVMTTHGRTGFSRLLMGSIARDTLERLQVPAFFIRPVGLEQSALPMELMYQKTGVPKPGERSSGQIVAALDGTPEAEVILQPALELCKVSGFGLCLLRVIPPYTPIVDGINYRAGDETNKRRAEASAYLERVRNRLAEPGIQIVLEVLDGNPTKAILEYTRQGKASILAMASHTRSRMSRLMVGSVAEEIMDESHLPVLMVHRN